MLIVLPGWLVAAMRAWLADEWGLTITLLPAVESIPPRMSRRVLTTTLIIITGRGSKKKLLATTREASSVVQQQQHHAAGAIDDDYIAQLHMVKHTHLQTPCADNCIYPQFAVPPL
jgi:hypothetical protein